MALIDDIFNPVVMIDTSIAGSLFQDTGLTTPATTNGQYVAAVKDWSGNDIHLLADGDTSTQPTLQLNSGGGKAAVNFPGGKKLTLGNPALINFDAASKFTIAIAFRPSSNGKFILTKRATNSESERIALGSGVYYNPNRFERYNCAWSLGNCSTSATNIGIYAAEDYFESSIATANYLSAGNLLERVCLNSNIVHIRYGYSPAAPSTSTPWTLGISATVSYSYSYAGLIQGLWIWNKVLTDAQIAAFNAYAGAQFGATIQTIPSTAQVVYAGNSLVYGSGSAPDPNGPFPEQIYNLQTEKLQFWNMGIGGMNTDAMLTDATKHYDSFYSAAYAKNILLAWQGSNGVTTAQGEYDKLVTFCQARRAIGWKVIVATSISRGDGSLSDTIRNALNALIVDGWATFADALADLSADSRLGADGACNNTTYFSSDKVHLKTAGYAVVAGIVKTSVDGLLSGNAYTVGVNDTVTESGEIAGSESSTVEVQESISIDAASSAGAILAEVLIDVLSHGGTVDTIVSAMAALDDGATFSELISPSGSTTYTVDIIDGFSCSEGASIALSSLASVSDGASVDAALSAVAQFLQSAVDSHTLTESVAEQVGAVISSVDSVDVTDGVTAGRSFADVLADALETSDNQDTQAAANANVADTVTETGAVAADGGQTETIINWSMAVTLTMESFPAVNYPRTY